MEEPRTVIRSKIAAGNERKQDLMLERQENIVYNEGNKSRKKSKTNFGGDNHGETFGRT